MEIDTQVLRQAMRNWATGVTIVTSFATSAAGVEKAGATVSSFTSVALDPPTVLVCLNKGTYVHEVIQRSGVYAVSMLGLDQEALSNRFAGTDPLVTDRFAGLQALTLQTGSPLIPGALAWLDCRVTQTLDTGTHSVFLANVVDVQVNSMGAPLVYYNRSYKHLVDPIRETS